MMTRRRAVPVAAAALAGPAAANDSIRVGLIGCGGRGNMELGYLVKLAGVRVVAVADVFRPFAEAARMRLGAGVDAYEDFRRILDRQDVDAVFVSTPDHWHAIPTVLACQSGKDVWCEKPLSHTIEEGRRILEAVRKYGRVLQTGSQQRSAAHFRRAVGMIQSGSIGTVTQIECWNVGNMPVEGIGNPPDESPPPGLNWDFYLGPAPYRPYNRNRFVFNYRWFWDYSGGMMTDWGAHHLDVVHWAMRVTGPLSVAAFGGRFVTRDNRETPDTLTAVFEYPGFTVRYTHRDANARSGEGGDHGMAFYGTLGTLLLDRSSCRVLPEMEPESAAVDHVARRLGQAPARLRAQSRLLCERVEETGIRIYPQAQEAHLRDFFECMRTRRRPAAGAEEGYRAARACHLAVIALRTGRRIRWDPVLERIPGDPEADRLMTKDYRDAWKLPRV